MLFERGHMRIEPTSTITLVPLSIRKEEEYYLVGSKRTNIFVKVCPSVKRVFEFLKTRPTYAALRKKYADVDIDGFLQDLMRHKFIAKIGNTTFHDKTPLRQHSLNFLKPRQVQWLFNPAMVMLYLLMCITGAMVLIAHPGYIPRPGDYFFISTYTLLIPLSFVIGWLLLFIHEIAHALAARAVGVDIRFSVSNRLHFLVGITELSGIYAIHRSKRYKTYLAGVVTDLMVVSAGVLLLFLHDQGVISFGMLLYRFIRFVVLMEFLGFLWQLLFFAKTDFYYVIENLLKTENLNYRTMSYYKHILKKIATRSFLAPCSHCRKQSLFPYSVIYLAGVTFALTLFGLYYIPILGHILAYGITTIFYGTVRYPLYDAIIAMIFLSINCTMLFYSLIRRHATRNKVLLGLFIAGMVLSGFATIFFQLLLVVAGSLPLPLLYVLLAVLGYLVASLNKEMIGQLQNIVPQFCSACSWFIMFTPLFFFAIEYVVPAMQLIPSIESIMVYTIGIVYGYWKGVTRSR